MGKKKTGGGSEKGDKRDCYLLSGTLRKKTLSDANKKNQKGKVMKGPDTRGKA